MYTNPSSPQSIRYVREALEKTIAPELQSDKAKVVLAMIQTILASVEKRIPVEIQYMADECNRMRAILAEARKRAEGVDSEAAAEVRAAAAAVAALPEFPPQASSAAVTDAYREASAQFTRALGALHGLIADGVEGAPELLQQARAYVALRFARDMQAVYAMEGGLIGKG
jgi:hypothetical protein